MRLTTSVYGISLVILVGLVIDVCLLYGYPWLSVVILGYIWLSVVILGYLWLFPININFWHPTVKVCFLCISGLLKLHNCICRNIRSNQHLPPPCCQHSLTAKTHKQCRLAIKKQVEERNSNDGHMDIFLLFVVEAILTLGNLYTSM